MVKHSIAAEGGMLLRPAHSWDGDFLCHYTARIPSYPLACGCQLLQQEGNCNLQQSLTEELLPHGAAVIVIFLVDNEKAGEHHTTIAGHKGMEDGTCHTNEH